MRFASLSVACLVPCLAPAALGCTGNVSVSAGESEAGTTTSAVVVVERTIDAVHGSRAEGSARFVRVSTLSSASDALRVIGASLDLPARGGCARVASLAGGTPRTDAAPVVELVDVGTVSLKASGLEMRLVPRQLPDVTDVVSGVIYARAAEPALLPASTGYVVHVSGGRDLGPFDFAASAPAEPSAVRIAGEDGRGIIVASVASVDLTWADDRSDDDVYVDVRPAGVRCVFGNVGHGSVPSPLFDDSGTLVVHRLHREPLRAPGIDSGEIRFDFARSVAYARR
jgi:hypothetical protein